MEILSAKLTGFKQFTEPTEFTFNPGDNYVEGDNNRGKTTIAEAVAYAILGRDLAGSVTVDHLIAKGASLMEVVVRFSHRGEIYTVARSRELTKRDTVNKVFLNDEKATQAKIDAIVGDWRYFLAAWNPGFIHSLDDAKASELLRSLTTPPAREVILAALDPIQQETLAKLHDRDLADPAAAQKRLRAEIKADETFVTKTTGEADVYKRQAAQIAPDEAQTFDKEVGALKETLKEARALRPGAEALPGLKQRQARLLANYNALKNAIEPIPAPPEYDDGSVCPTCGQGLPLEAFGKVLEAYEKTVQRIVERNDQRKAQIQEIVNEAQGVAAQVKEAEATGTEQDAQDLKNLEAMLADYEAKNLIAQQQNQQRTFTLAQINDASAKLNKALAAIQETKDGIPGKTTAIEALGAFAEKKEELTIDQIRQHFKRLDVQLFKVVKETGELKPAFDLTFDGQPYKTMSNSNRIRAGLEVAVAINAITAWNYPTYIDNAEAIADFEAPAGQYFRAVVKPGADLAVNPAEPIEPPAAEPITPPEPPKIKKPRKDKTVPPEPMDPKPAPDTIPEFPTVEAPSSGPDRPGPREGESLLEYHKRMTSRLKI